MSSEAQIEPGSTANVRSSPAKGARLHLAGRVRERLERHSLGVYAGLLMAILLAAILAPRVFVIVPAGHAGVLWRPLSSGTAILERYGEGMHVILPWNRMVLYDVRLIHGERTYDAISSTGLAMKVEIAVRYRLDREFAGLVHSRVGPNYPEVLIYPEINAHVRELIGIHTPEELYTEKRAAIQEEIKKRLVGEIADALGERMQSRAGGVVVDDVLIRSIELPQLVASAIERKTEQQQVMMEYDFRIAREAKEAQRKRIEAEGIRDFQSTVAGTITPEYLRLRGIDATSALANSPNSKTVIIGGRDGLPVILNTADGLPSASMPAASAPRRTPGPAQALPTMSPNAARAQERVLP